MQLEVRMTDADYINFNLFQHADTLQRTINTNKRSVPLLFATTIFLLIAGRADPQFILFMLVFTFLGSIVWIALTGVITRKHYTESLEKIVMAGKGIYSPFSKLTFGDSTILEENDDMTLELRYKVIKKLCVNEGCRYLFHSEHTAFVIPDSSFESEIHMQQFVMLMEGKTGLKFE